MVSVLAFYPTIRVQILPTPKVCSVSHEIVQYLITRIKVIWVDSDWHKCEQFNSIYSESSNPLKAFD